MNHSAGMDGARLVSSLQFAPQLRDPRKIQIRLLAHDAHASFTRYSGHVGGDNDTSRVARGQLRLVFGVTEKTQLASLRSLQGSEPMDKNFRIAVKRSAKFLNNLA